MDPASSQPMIQLGGAGKAPAADAALRDIAQAAAASQRAEKRRQSDAAAQYRPVQSKAPKAVWKQPKLWLQAAAALMMAAAIGKGLWLASQQEERQAAMSSPAPMMKAPPRPALVKTSNIALESHEFSHALQRLTDVFETFPDRDPMDIVQELNAKAGPSDPLVCPFGMGSGNEPELLLGRSGSVSIVNAINNCADGAERLHNAPVN